MSYELKLGYKDGHELEVRGVEDFQVSRRYVYMKVEHSPKADCIEKSLLQSLQRRTNTSTDRGWYDVSLGKSQTFSPDV